MDNINVEANEKYSKAFFDFFKEKLGISGDRGYMFVVFVSGNPSSARTDVFVPLEPSLTLAEDSWGKCPIGVLRRLIVAA